MAAAPKTFGAACLPGSNFRPDSEEYVRADAIPAAPVELIAQAHRHRRHSNRRAVWSPLAVNTGESSYRLVRRAEC